MIENRIKLTENTLHRIVKEVISKTKKMIMESANLNDVYEKFYKGKLPKETFFFISKLDPTSKNNLKGKYLQWIIREYAKEIYYDNDFSYLIQSALGWYDTHKTLLPKHLMDIYKLSLEDVVEIWQEYKDSIFTKQELKNLYNVEYEDDEWIIYHPHSYEAERYIVWHLYNGTSWCTSNGENATHPGPSYFHKYENDTDNSLYILARKKDKQLFQFSSSSLELFNKFNRQTSVKQINLNKGVINWFREKFNLNVIQLLKSKETESDDNELYDMDDEELEDYFIDFKY